MTTKHTPGPWELYKKSEEEWIVRTNTFGLISLVPIDVDNCTEKWIKANACLIAAAPDLLEACKAVSCRAPIMGSTGDYREGQLHALEAVRDFLAPIIAKAEGK